MGASSRRLWDENDGIENTQAPSAKRDQIANITRDPESAPR
jgi:hypothetical protein